MNLQFTSASNALLLDNAGTCWLASNIQLGRIFTNGWSITSSVCWKIWDARNDKIWNRLVVPAFTIVRGAQKDGLQLVLRDANGAFVAREVPWFDLFRPDEAEAIGVKEALR
nr:uncharacterized protein LOC109177106 [Ipomoea batatas]